MPVIPPPPLLLWTGNIEKFAKQMILYDINPTLHDIRTLCDLAESFSDILLKEKETRERTAKLDTV
jgi:hypothetical protein